ncbi:hypothetical protein P2R12_20350 [Cytobacillus oceanisediminis]|uniref:hypothetical protein n=1 Tax=Cytobacillus oceanisediminis TaxID=665099 RepID=UPI0023DB6919|nr:hypothetical protein [Cytobacillus oceanisediminis]MDF2039287.1 hypothetical protein [Cytobacillus oceanisediminis]
MLDKDDKVKENTEDPLTHFLFGERVRRHEPAKGENESDRRAEEAQGIDDWLFGGRSRNAHEADEWLLGGKSRETNERDNPPNENGNNILNNINFEELMGNIDTLMTSAHQLKPLLKKAGPLLEMFLKK